MQTKCFCGEAEIWHYTIAADTDVYTVHTYNGMRGKQRRMWNRAISDLSADFAPSISSKCVCLSCHSCCVAVFRCQVKFCLARFPFSCLPYYVNDEVRHRRACVRVIVWQTWDVDVDNLHCRRLLHQMFVSYIGVAI